MVVGMAVVAVAAGCRVSPLTNKIAVGQEPFVVFVGEGPGGATDLFAVAASGGEVIQLSYNRERESSPALDPSGSMVAFLRQPARDTDQAYLVVMNLLSAAERETHVPTALGIPSRIGWTRDGEHIVVQVEAGVLETAAPPDRLDLAPLPETGELRIEADSGLSVLLGEPAFAKAVTCSGGVCVEQPSGAQSRIDEGGDPLRWGPDSLAYVKNEVLWVRPLGAGRSRRVHWSRAPSNPREPTYFGGSDRAG